ncbi:MAG: hypothetical protein WAU86_10730 [Oricola sp.]
MSQKRRIFTITAGRTGTAWLADLFSGNLECHCIHEPLEVFDFGVSMPDIRILRAFNEYGNCDAVREFWERKIGLIEQHDCYIETNHTLAKCGLIENIADSAIAGDTTIVNLRRNKVKQCVSYIVRNDFNNMTLIWQWFLHPGYRKKIINPEPFFAIGQIGMIVWYIFEIEARQVYYKKKFGAKLKFVDADLEVITTEKGAREFWDRLGLTGEITLPPPANRTEGAPPPPALVDQITQVFAAINFDAETIVDAFIESGASLA